ncbi:MAG: sugar transferase [Dictyoglomaceae bacterium]|nr:sugar transferase [Dictyoglomaceae bacterium]
MERIRREILWLFLLILLDLVCLISSVPLAYYIRFNFLIKIPELYLPESDFPVFYPYYFYLSIFFGIMALIILIWNKAYDLKKYFSFGPIFFSVALSIFVLSFLSFFYRDFSFSRLIFILTGFSALFLIFINRIVLLLLRWGLFKLDRNITKILLVGDNEIANILIDFWNRNPWVGYKLYKNVSELSYIKENLEDLSNIQEIIITHPIKNDEILNLIEISRKKGVIIKIVPDLYLLFGSQIIFDEISGIPIVRIKGSNLEGWQGYIKEIEDIIFATFGLIFFLPFIIIISLLIKLDSEGPIIFKHKRVGRYGKDIYVWKFRTMYKDADKILEVNPILKLEFEKDFKLKDDPRVTKIGKFLRKWSLDEIPQFFNILKGDMSIVGPRPVVRRELEKYGAFADEILKVKPGLTGLWQVSGRSDLDYARRVQLDLYYIQNWSISLDFKIILKTIPSVILRKGAY